jgi:hypothetical protein
VIDQTIMIGMLSVVLFAFAIPTIIAEGSGADKFLPPQEPYEELNFYYDGEKWSPNWFQCERGQDVAVFLQKIDSTTQSLLRFPKAKPESKSIVALREVEEHDCGMMKCWWSFKALGRTSTFYSIEESHYFDPDAGFISRQHRLGDGPSLTGAKRSAQGPPGVCRWYPWLRIAALTSQHSFYVTQNSSGALLLRVFDFKRTGNQPSTVIPAGSLVVDARGESYSFHRASAQYTFTVSLTPPGIEIQTRSRRAGTERPISYMYVQKVSSSAQ